jgi:hypothetical protein
MNKKLVSRVFMASLPVYNAKKEESQQYKKLMKVVDRHRKSKDHEVAVQVHEKPFYRQEWARPEEAPPEPERYIVNPEWEAWDKANKMTFQTKLDCTKTFVAIVIKRKDLA